MKDAGRLSSITTPHITFYVRQQFMGLSLFAPAIAMAGLFINFSDPYSQQLCPDCIFLISEAFLFWTAFLHGFQMLWESWETEKGTVGYLKFQEQRVIFSFVGYCQALQITASLVDQAAFFLEDIGSLGS